MTPRSPGVSPPKLSTERRTLILGIGSKRNHLYTTTIRIGAEAQRTAQAESQSSGRTVRPHLRRGHIRRQHFGPGREMQKSIWIEPTFVNGLVPDEREAYNVSKPRVVSHAN